MKTTAAANSLALMKEWIEVNRPHWLEDFMTFLRFPSISLEPEYKSALLECTKWLAG